MMKLYQVQPGPFHFLGLLFALVGYLLVWLCFLGCLKPSGSALYFAKVEAISSSDPEPYLAFFYGWQGYCAQENNDISCYRDRDVMVLPFDDSIVQQLNTKYPALFEDPVEQETDTNPEAAPSPPHDPKIFHATILQVILSTWLIFLCIFQLTTPYYYYRDDYYTRGFLACGCSVASLLLTILSSIMYQDAIEQLNLTYPHLQASQGPCIILTGVSFACYFLAAVCLMRGFVKSVDSHHNNNPDYI